MYTDYDKWFDEYKPVENHIDNNASFDGCMFETYGEELRHILATDSYKVWTLLEDDYGNQCVTNGYHIVNRLGYFITEKPWEEGQDFNIYDSDTIELYERRDKRQKEGYTPETKITVKPTNEPNERNVSAFGGQEVRLAYSPDDYSYVLLWNEPDEDADADERLWGPERYNDVQEAVNAAHFCGAIIMSDDIAIWSQDEDED